MEWQQIDLDKVCKAGREVYTSERYRAFLAKVLGWPAPGLENTAQLEFWQINRKYVLYFTYKDRVAIINIRQSVIKLGHPQTEKVRPCPLPWDDDQMELDLMCIFLRDTVDAAPRGQFWFPEEDGDKK